MGFINYIKLLIRSNSGESSKGFLFVTITIAALSLLTISGFALLVDVILNGHILTDLFGMAAFVGSISTLLGAVGFTKVYGDKYDAQICNKCKKKSYENIITRDNDASPSAKISDEEANNVL